MKRLLVKLLCMVLLAPAFAFAADVPAGFAPGAVWLSKTNLEDGQSVQLYTVLYDSANAAIAGNVSFLVDGSTVSSQPFELAAGSTKIVSTVWQAVQGSHTIGASLDGVVNKDTGEALTLNSAASTSVLIEVAAPPPPPPVAAAVSAATAAIQANAPAVIAAVQSAYNSLEYLRQNAVSSLENQLAASGVAATVGNSPEQQILGTSTSNLVASANGSGNLSDILHTVWRSAISALLFITQVQIFFYGSLVVVFLIFLKLLRILLSERRHPYRD